MIIYVKSHKMIFHVKSHKMIGYMKSYKLNRINVEIYKCLPGFIGMQCVL